MKRLTLVSMAAVFVISALAGAAHAGKSVYLVAKHHTSQFDAYNLALDGTISQATNTSLEQKSPAGLASWAELDQYSVPIKAYLFVSGEHSDEVELIDALTLTSIESVETTAGELAGIAMDETNMVLYGIERGGKKLYALDWDPDIPALTVKPGFPVVLPTVSQAYGLALDSKHGIIYIADTGAGYVRGFNVYDLTNQVFIWEPTSIPVDIDIDEYRNILYTTHPTGKCAPREPGFPAGPSLTCMYDVASGVEYCDPNCKSGMGVAVNDDTGLIYLTHGCDTNSDDDYDVSVWDTNASPWTLIQTISEVGTPAGIAVPGFGIPGNPGIILTNNKDPECVNTAEQVEIYVKYFYKGIGGATLPATNVQVEVHLNEDLLFVSATNGGTYDNGSHTVSWNVGTMNIDDEAMQTIVAAVSVDADYPRAFLSTGIVSSTEVPPIDWDTYATRVDLCDPAVCGDGIKEGSEQCEQHSDCLGLDYLPEPGADEWYECSSNCQCKIVPITLSYLKASRINDTIEITWGTASEINNAGFNILRSQARDGEYVQINSVLIPADGGPMQGADYSYTDNTVEEGITYWYKLEDVATDGNRELHGPVTDAELAQQQSWGAASTAEAGSIGRTGSTPFNYCYVAALPLLFVGLWLGISARRRKN